MKYYIKQKVFTLGERFAIKDETGADRFYVEGSFFQIPKSFKIFDAQGRQVASIERELFRLLPKYRITTADSEIRLERAFTFFRMQFHIIGEPWSLGGNFIGMNYQILSGDRIIMRLQKHWFTWGDSYELDILDEENAVEAIAIAICVDSEIARDSQANNSAN